MSSLIHLLKKYDVAGPRYTSYPTAPAWNTEVGASDFQRSLNRLSPGEPLSLYFHLPFCENLCHFCGCMTVITRQHDRSSLYTKVLIEEIKRVANCIPGEVRDRQVVQIHFGGGSPNFFRPEEIQEIMEEIRSNFHLLPQAEIAIEMHPRTSTPEFCQKVAALGFNRISLGVQDLDPTVQKLINRHQTYEMTEAMIASLRSLGLKHFNFDLIYGLPGQTMTGWEKTLEQVLFLKPDRLAVYSYAHVPWLKPYQRSFEDKDLPPPEMKLLLFEKAYQVLTGHGYRSIGMDHFALEEDELSRALEEGSLHRNFMGYSTQADAHQIGMGVSSISYVGGNYFQNAKELASYSEAIQGNRLATFRGHILDRDDAMRRDLITKIMCCGRIDKRDFEKKWGVKFDDYFREEVERLQPFQEDGLLRVKEKDKDGEESLEVVGSGFLVLRNIAMNFDRYLEDVRKNATHPVFSRTV